VRSGSGTTRRAAPTVDSPTEVLASTRSTAIGRTAELMSGRPGLDELHAHVGVPDDREDVPARARGEHRLVGGRTDRADAGVDDPLPV
jgi:hypothetical protein